MNATIAFLCVWTALNVGFLIMNIHHRHEIEKEITKHIGESIEDVRAERLAWAKEKVGRKKVLADSLASANPIAPSGKGGVP